MIFFDSRGESEPEHNIIRLRGPRQDYIVILEINLRMKCNFIPVRQAGSPMGRSIILLVELLPMNEVF